MRNMTLSGAKGGEDAQYGLLFKIRDGSAELSELNDLAIALSQEDCLKTDLSALFIIRKLFFIYEIIQFSIDRQVDIEKKKLLVRILTEISRIIVPDKSVNYSKNFY